jgi:hypothetical protein
MTMADSRNKLKQAADEALLEIKKIDYQAQKLPADHAQRYRFKPQNNYSETESAQQFAEKYTQFIKHFEVKAAEPDSKIPDIKGDAKYNQAKAKMEALNIELAKQYQGMIERNPLDEKKLHHAFNEANTALMNLKNIPIADDKDDKKKEAHNAYIEKKQNELKKIQDTLLIQDLEKLKTSCNGQNTNLIHQRLALELGRDTKEMLAREVFDIDQDRLVLDQIALRGIPQSALEREDWERRVENVATKRNHTFQLPRKPGDPPVFMTVSQDGIARLAVNIEFEGWFSDNKEKRKQFDFYYDYLIDHQIIANKEKKVTLHFDTPRDFSKSQFLRMLELVRQKGDVEVSLGDPQSVIMQKLLSPKQAFDKNSFTPEEANKIFAEVTAINKAAQLKQLEDKEKIRAMTGVSISEITDRLKAHEANRLPDDLKAPVVFVPLVEEKKGFEPIMDDAVRQVLSHHSSPDPEERLKAEIKSLDGRLAQVERAYEILKDKLNDAKDAHRIDLDAVIDADLIEVKQDYNIRFAHHPEELKLAREIQKEMKDIADRGGVLNKVNECKDEGSPHKENFENITRKFQALNTKFETMVKITPTPDEAKAALELPEVKRPHAGGVAP